MEVARKEQSPARMRVEVCASSSNLNSRSSVVPGAGGCPGPGMAVVSERARAYLMGVQPYGSLPQVGERFQMASSRKIGEGKHSDVLLAMDNKTGRELAIKVLSLGHSSERRARFEALAMTDLDHPNCVRIADVLQCQEQLPAVRGEPPYMCIAMEYVAAERLSQLILRDGADTQLALRVALQMASALSHVHRVGLVHRDLWSENILVGRSGHITLIDFGCAEYLCSDGPPEDHMNLPYASPEMARRQKQQAGDDCWALGLVVTETATGQIIGHRMGRFDVPVHMKPDKLRSAIEDTRAVGGPLLGSIAEQLLELDGSRRASMGSVVMQVCGAGATPAAVLGSASGSSNRRESVVSVVSGVESHSPPMKPQVPGMPPPSTKQGPAASGVQATGSWAPSPRGVSMQGVAAPMSPRPPRHPGCFPEDVGVGGSVTLAGGGKSGTLPQGTSTLQTPSWVPSPKVQSVTLTLPPTIPVSPRQPPTMALSVRGPAPEGGRGRSASVTGVGSMSSWTPTTRAVMSPMPPPPLASVRLDEAPPPQVTGMGSMSSWAPTSRAVMSPMPPPPLASVRLDDAPPPQVASHACLSTRTPTVRAPMSPAPPPSASVRLDEVTALGSMTSRTPTARVPMSPIMPPPAIRNDEVSSATCGGNPSPRPLCRRQPITPRSVRGKEDVYASSPSLGSVCHGQGMLSQPKSCDAKTRAPALGRVSSCSWQLHRVSSRVLTEVEEIEAWRKANLSARPASVTPKNAVTHQSAAQRCASAKMTSRPSPPTPGGGVTRMSSQVNFVVPEQRVLKSHASSTGLGWPARRTSAMRGA